MIQDYFWHLLLYSERNVQILTLILYGFTLVSSFEYLSSGPLYRRIVA